MRINAKNIARGLQLEGVNRKGKAAVLASRTWQDLQEALDAGMEGRPGGITPESFSLRDLAAHTIVHTDGSPVGQAFVEDAFDPRNAGEFQEAIAAVDSSAFAGITGQLMISRVLSAYNSEEFVATKMVPTVSTRLSGERVPGITMPEDPGDDVTVANEQDELKYVGFSEEYVETPQTQKRQIGIAVTREDIFFDRTGLMLQRASGVGNILGLRKEKRIIGVMIGAVNNYKEKRKGDAAAVALKTFYSATDSGRWCNHFDGNSLTDWTAIDTAEGKFADLIDPNTGEPIVMDLNRVVFAPQIKFLAVNQLLMANQVYKLTGSDTVRTVGPNPLQNLGITLATSRQLKKQLVAQMSLDADTAAGYWFYGDPAKAFAYMENWPITVTQAPSNSEAEFSQDIVLRFKASERGAAAVIEPRAWQRHRALSTSSSSGA